LINNNLPNAILPINIQASGLSGHGVFTIFESTDLQTWLPVYSNPPVLGTFDWIDGDSTNIAIKFYKLSEQ
jgi:hypothetical protein